MTFPILAYREHDTRLYVYKSNRTLIRTSRELLKQNIFNGAFLVDSRGNKFRIKSAKELGWATPFLGYSLMRKGRQILVDFDLENLGTVSLFELKEFVLHKINEGPDFVLKEIRWKIEEASDYSSVFACII